MPTRPRGGASVPPVDGPVLERDVALQPLDVRASFAMQALGRYDPTASLGDDTFVKLVGPHLGRVAVRRSAGGLVVRAEGEAAVALVDGWATHLPVDDGLHDFTPRHEAIARLHREAPGLRLLRVPWIVDVAFGAVLQQRVTFGDACAAFRRLAWKHGVAHRTHVAFPDAARVAGLADWDLREIGVDPRRARALVGLAREEASRPFLRTADRATLRQRLLAIPGIGPWTTEMILGFGAGDPDALPLGDVHLPRLVGEALDPEARGRLDDARMVDLLEPYRGHRFRVVRLLVAAAFRRRSRG